LIIVDILASTEAFVGTVCLIGIRHWVSGWTGRRCGRVGKTPRLRSPTSTTTCLPRNWGRNVNNNQKRLFC